MSTTWTMIDFSTPGPTTSFRNSREKAEPASPLLLFLQLALQVLQPGFQIVSGFRQPRRVVDDVRGKKGDQLRTAGSFRLGAESRAQHRNPMQEGNSIGRFRRSEERREGNSIGRFR